ncbi:MAG: flagellar protein [Oscillospiraceae bacterium]|jgi:flagellar operon protein|nr:flagellar protein [Oscillospiraceae bacterium]
MDININRIQPITTGLAPSTATAQRAQWQDKSATSTQSFGDILKTQLSEKSGLNFSKHAIARISTRGVEVNEELERLQEGVETASNKGLNDALILVNNSAYIVNVPNKTVVTAVANGNLRGSSFTNIDGTVIA